MANEEREPLKTSLLNYKLKKPKAGTPGTSLLNCKLINQKTGAPENGSLYSFKKLALWLENIKKYDFYLWSRISVICKIFSFIL